MENKEPVMCHYVPGHSNIVDTVNPATGRTYWFDKSLEQSPGAVLISMDEAFNQIEQADRAKYCKGVTEITEKDWYENLEVLPPVGWTSSYDNTESFKISERLTGNLTAIYMRKGTRYFTVTDDIQTAHEELFDKYKEDMK